MLIMLNYLLDHLDKNECLIVSLQSSILNQEEGFDNLGVKLYLILSWNDQTEDV